MNGCTIQLWYNKQRVKKNGNVSLYLQIIGVKESSEVALKLDWPAEFFDWNKKMLTPRMPNDPDLLEYNIIIETERSRYWSVMKDLLSEKREISVAEVFRRVNLGTRAEKFCAFFKYAIKARQTTKNDRDRIKEITAGPYNVTLKWLEGFVGDGDIQILNINRVWMERFANYLREHMVENSVWARIKDIKAMLAYAARQDIRVNNDYKKFNITPEDSDPTWLEESELNDLLNLYQNEFIHEKTKRYLKAFLFACFTGLRVSDLMRWNKSWIDGDYISFVPQKRRLSKKVPKPLVIPIIEIARDFINDLNSETFEIPCDQTYNKELKHIGKAAGISKKLTSHVARHTFATWLAIDQVPVIVISKLLGHKSVKTTLIYVHIADKYKAVEMMKLQRRFGLKKQPQKKGPDNEVYFD